LRSRRFWDSGVANPRVSTLSRVWKQACCVIPNVAGNLALVGEQFEIARSARNERDDLWALGAGVSLYVVDSKGLIRAPAASSAYGEP
jgi:hypothetical protein